MVVVILVAGFVIFLLTLGIRAQFKKRATGSEGIVGEIGTAKTNIKSDGGTVYVHGEFWNAVSDLLIKKGSKVRVVGVNEMVLKVEPVD
jgi:membrane-bound serine protease (ClpP class)